MEDFEEIKYTLETIPSIPAWAGTYTERRQTAEDAVEEQFSEIYAAHQAEVVSAHDAAVEAEAKRLRDKADELNRDKKKPSDPDITPEQVEEEEREQGRNTEPEDPEFAVFLNGYGQTSPLFRIFQKCSDAGHGVTYNAGKGLCNFTESYCKRFGMDFFYNDQLAVYDCELARGQAAAEFLFGFTVTRSFKRAGEAVFGVSRGRSSLSALGASRDHHPCHNGACYTALGSTRVAGGVQMKRINNGETFNSMQARSALLSIKTVGLSGFEL